MTCPDITFSVSTLSQYLKAPHTTLLHAVTRVFRYLSGTKEYKLVLGGTDTSIFGDADSDYASQIHPHSISAFFISKGVVSWSSKKQPIRLNMSLLHMPQKISSEFKKFSKISHLYFLIPLQKISTVTTKARSVYPRTQLFTVTPNILMFIFILFGTVFQCHITLLYCPMDDMIADTFAVSSLRSSANFLVFFDPASFSRGSVEHLLAHILFYFICFTFSIANRLCLLFLLFFISWVPSSYDSYLHTSCLFSYWGVSLRFHIIIYLLLIHSSTLLYFFQYF